MESITTQERVRALAGYIDIDVKDIATLLLSY
jgi:hypothetical protein